MQLKLLNIGCGNHYHNNWVNLDFVSNSKDVIAHNLLIGIPFEHETFNVVYHSHVLEHFTQEEGKKLIEECFRVLKSNGIIRIVVPDLEQIAKNYLQYLEVASQGDNSADFKYEWSKIELIDQIARNYSGGFMAQTISTVNSENFSFIKSRLGMEIKNDAEIKEKSSFLTLIKKINIRKLKYFGAKLILYFLGGFNFVKAFKTGYFRVFIGENHQWMYDRYSLNKILLNAGFKNIKVCQANESMISDFNHYQLDMVGDEIRKPDSLFIEAIK